MHCAPNIFQNYVGGRKLRACFEIFLCRVWIESRGVQPIVFGYLLFIYFSFIGDVGLRKMVFADYRSNT